jgi:hypothetical protein
MDIKTALLVLAVKSIVLMGECLGICPAQTGGELAPGVIGIQGQ